MNRFISYIIFLAFLLSCDILVADEAFVYKDHGLRDPFWPLVSQGGAIVNYDTNFMVSEMTLEGIVSDGEGGVAIINGNIVEQGKKIGLYTVQEIRKDRVILLKDGATSILQIKKEE
jgi:Tfp pilus assembly protein PilP